MLQQLDIISFLSVKGVGKKTAFKAIKSSVKSLKDAQEILSGITSRNITEKEISDAYTKAEDIIRTAAKSNTYIIEFGSNDYPHSFTQIKDPPLVIFAKGNIECLKLPSVAVIGTRKPSEYGKKCADRFGKRLAENGINVVSGLALGCDAAAHLGCLEAGGLTIAVLAHGLDMIYPAENKHISNMILNNKSKIGCLISEYKIGEKPRKNYFVERDRLQSALSEIVLVVETSILGGTMHTARFAKDQGKIIACLDFSNTSSLPIDASGNAKLLSEGAYRLSEKFDLDNLLKSKKDMLYKQEELKFNTKKLYTTNTGLIQLTLPIETKK